MTSLDVRATFVKKADKNGIKEETKTTASGRSRHAGYLYEEGQGVKSTNAWLAWGGHPALTPPSYISISPAETLPWSTTEEARQGMRKGRIDSKERHEAKGSRGRATSLADEACPLFPIADWVQNSCHGT